MSSVVPKPRVFGSNLSNKAEASATPVNGKAASAKLLAEQQAKLTAQQAKLEEWQKQKAASSLKAPVATAAKRPSVAVAAPTTAVTAAPPLQLSTTPHSALSTPTNSAKLASASAANHTTEIFYTPSSSPTSFKQRTATSDAGALALSSALIPDAALASDELRQLRERIATLENGTELAELRARNSDLERLAGELRSLNGELRRANSRLRESGAADTAPDAGEASRLHARVAELEHALALANSEIGALQAARHAAAGTPADVAALEQSLRDAKHALAQARADARAAQQNADEARSALQAATEALDAADEEQSALRREADDAHERLAQQQERAVRTRVAEAAAAAGRTLAVQHERSQKAVAEAVERLRRLLAAKAAASAARSRTTAATATKPTPAVADVPSSPSSAGGTKRAATEPSDPPQSKRTTVDSGTQTVGWSREHEFECLRFSHDLLAQRMAEMRGQFTQKLQHMHKLQDAVEQRRQTEAQEWSDMLSTTVESLKAQMTNGLKESVLRVRQLQSELECEQQLNERLAAELEQLRAAEPGSAPDSLSAASPVARALERLREQLQTSRSRVDELESENELLMEKLVECETVPVPAPEPEQTQPAASPPPKREVAPLADADEERVAAQRDAMECFPSMENVTMTRRRGRK